MKKFLITGLLGSFLIAGFVAHDWLIQREIESTQNQILSQINQQFAAASSAERVKHLASETVAYERYLEPVVLAASRLLWPFGRADLITHWKRVTNTKIEDVSQARILNFQSEFETQLKNIRKEDPSVSRLNKILENFDAEASTMSCKQTVSEELKSITEGSKQKDEETLASIRSQGTEKLRGLKRHLNKMTREQIGDYLSSAKFLKELETPLGDLILSIKQEAVRRATWTDFQEKLTEILTKKRMQIAKLQTDREKQFEKLFKPLAEAFTEPVRAPIPNTQLNSPNPMIPHVETQMEEIPYDQTK